MQLSNPVANLIRIQGDSAAYNLTHRGYGFQGDPLRPQSGHYYGFLVQAGDSEGHVAGRR